jgi:hypothetical protein
MTKETAFSDTMQAQVLPERRIGDLEKQRIEDLEKQVEELTRVLDSLCEDLFMTIDIEWTVQTVDYLTSRVEQLERKAEK